MLINNFLLPLILTIATEIGIALLLGHRGKQIIFLVAAINGITNPFMNLISVLLIFWGMHSIFYLVVLPLEVLLIPIEYLMLSYAMPKDRNHFLKLSAIMNISSFIIGLLVL